MPYVEGNFRTFTVGATQIPAFSAVKLVGGVLVAATAATDIIVGVIGQIGYANQQVDVRLRSANGTLNMIASAQININDAVTTTANGTAVTTTTTGNQIIGYAVTAAAAGQLVELQIVNSKY